MRIGLTGSNGQLGRCLLESKPTNLEWVPLTHSDVDVSSKARVFETLGELKLDLVINTAAFHNVEECHKSPDIAYDVNAVGVRNLSLFCKKKKIKLVHISTNYVFDGLSLVPYVEEDVPNPLSWYARTKLMGEFFIQNIFDNYLIVRTAGLYSMFPCRAKKGQNFVNIMLNLASEQKEIKVVDDEYINPTNAEYLAAQILLLIQADATGVYHVVSNNFCSWYEFAQKIFEFSNLAPNLSPVHRQDVVSRPQNGSLKNGLLDRKRLNVMSSWENELGSYINKIKC
jgi:dTDP-4-dehydrorhamnose reductase